MFPRHDQAGMWQWKYRQVTLAAHSILNLLHLNSQLQIDNRCVESPLNADADSGDSQRVLQEFQIDVLAGVLGGVGAAAITGFTAWYVRRRCQASTGKTVTLTADIVV